MYCIKCGVKLQDGVKQCPLCETPVLLNSESEQQIKKTYSDCYPQENNHERLLALSLITFLLSGLVISCVIFCLSTYSQLAWGGIVMLGIALGYILFVLPAWFPKWMPFIFIPIDFLSVSAYLLYLCQKLHGNWYLSFAFPVTMIYMIITVSFLILFRRIESGRLLLFGIYTVVFGCSFMLVEFFAHITFSVPMFKWSLYCVVVFSLFGLFMTIAGLLPPLRDLLKRKFFI